MANLLPRIPASSGDKLQYMSHSMNDSSTRFVVCYPGPIDVSLLRQAMRHLVDRIFVLHASFVPANPPYWQENGGYTTQDTVQLFSLAPGADVLARAQSAALRPVHFDDNFQLYCAVVDNGTQSALALVVSHLVADGGDAKYVLLKLVELYNCLLGGGDPSTVPIKDGDRELTQAFDHVDPSVLEHWVSDPPERSWVRAHSSFSFPQPEEVGIPRILRRTLPAELLAQARQKAKPLGATVNDLLLSAYYRAIVRQQGLSQQTPVAVLSMLDLRQYMKNRQSQGICNLSNTLTTKLPHGVGPDFRTTLKTVTAQTRAAKSDGMAGFHNMKWSRLAVKRVFSLPFPLLTSAGKFVTRRMPIGMTNLGNVPGEALVLGDMPPVDAFFAGQVKQKPGIQMAVMSLDNVASLTITNRCGDQDAAVLELLLQYVEEELEGFLREP